MPLRKSDVMRMRINIHKKLRGKDEASTVETDLSLKKKQRRNEEA